MSKLSFTLWFTIGGIILVWMIAIIQMIPPMYTHVKNLEALSRVQGCSYIEHRQGVVFMWCDKDVRSFKDPYYNDK